MEPLTRAVAATSRVVSKRIGDDWTDRAILFGVTICCLGAGRIWAGGSPLPHDALPGIFVACLLVGLRAPDGELYRRVWRVWLAWVLALAYVGAVHALAYLVSWASDTIWCTSRAAWRQGGLEAAFGWIAWSVGPAVSGALVAGAVRRLKPSRRMPSAPPSWDASDTDLAVFFGLLFVASYLGHRWRHELGFDLDLAAVVLCFAIAAWRAPFAEQFTRVRKLWVGVALVSWSFIQLPILLVSMDRDAARSLAGGFTAGTLFGLLSAFELAVLAYLVFFCVWLVRHAYAEYCLRRVREAGATSRE
jgi:hypothetical protein